jgi:hypothetical protein
MRLVATNLRRTKAMTPNSDKLPYSLFKTFGLKYYEVNPQSWIEAKEYGQNLPNFVYRGQANNKWPLTTSLERAAKRYKCPPDQIYNKEKHIIREFKARAHHFVNSPPDNREVIEWLSIIQDFGGPTRLLDFTTSFYVAAFFALESADDDACVWAINSLPLAFPPYIIDSTGGEKIFVDNHYESIDFTSEEVVRYAESFIQNPSKAFNLILRIKPTRLNERIAIQKGLFLFSCDLSNSFENNLCETFGLPFEMLDTSNASDSQGLLDNLKSQTANDTLNLDTAIIKINLPKQLQLHAIKDLHNMNIDAATLFPGLEGFARSLNYMFGAGPTNVRINLGIPAAEKTNSETFTSSSDNPSHPEG